MLHLNRRTFVIASTAALLVSILVTGAWSQSRSKKDKGPRALGVIEFTANGKARLMPVAIFVNDQWFDAGLYLATPRPMSLDPETVYEGFRAGDSQGLFTVTGVAQLGNDWIGLGTWKPKGTAEATKKTTTPKPTTAYTQDEDERPVLRRPGSAKTTPETASPKPTEQNTSSPAASSSDKPSAADKKDEAAKPSAPPQKAAPSEEDASRPRLRRGTPGVEQAESIGMPSSAADFKNATAKNGTAQSPLIVKAIAAISDAGGPEPRSYVFQTNPTERANYLERMDVLASQALQKFVAQRFKGMSAPPATPENSKVEIFDVSGGNEPVLVLTVRIPPVDPSAPGRTPAPGTPKAQRNARTAKTTVAPKPVVTSVELDATVVARIDYNGELHKLFDSVTDSTRLDSYPKLDLIDAVDANGDGIAELLFRQTYDRNHGFVLYRVGADQLWQLFEGAER